MDYEKLVAEFGKEQADAIMGQFAADPRLQRMTPQRLGQMEADAIEQASYGGSGTMQPTPERDTRQFISDGWTGGLEKLGMDPYTARTQGRNMAEASDFVGGLGDVIGFDEADASFGRAGEAYDRGEYVKSAIEGGVGGMEGILSAIGMFGTVGKGVSKGGKAALRAAKNSMMSDVASPTERWAAGHNRGPALDDRMLVNLPEVTRDTGLLKRVGDVNRVNDMQVEMDIPRNRPTNLPSAEDLIDRPWHSGMSDTSRGKMERIRSIDGNEVDTTMYGGRDYSLYQDGKAWASEENLAQGILNSAREAEKQAGVRGAAMGIPYQMGAPSPDFATFNTGLMLQHARSSLTNKARKALDTRIRDGVKGAKPSSDNYGVPEWKGIDHPDAVSQLKALGGKRKQVGKAFDDFRSEGTLDLSRARAIVTDPDQFNPRLGNLHNIANYDTSKAIAPSMHPTYNHDVMGSYNSTFGAPVSVFELNPQSGAGNRIPFVSDAKSRGYDFDAKKLSPSLGKAMMGGLIGKFDRDTIDMLIKKGAIQP